MKNLQYGELYRRRYFPLAILQFLYSHIILLAFSCSSVVIFMTQPVETQEKVQKVATQAFVGFSAVILMLFFSLIAAFFLALFSGRGCFGIDIQELFGL